MNSRIFSILAQMEQHGVQAEADAREQYYNLMSHIQHYVSAVATVTTPEELEAIKVLKEMLDANEGIPEIIGDELNHGEKFTNWIQRLSGIKPAED